MELQETPLHLDIQQIHWPQLQQYYTAPIIDANDRHNDIARATEYVRAEDTVLDDDNERYMNNTKPCVSKHTNKSIVHIKSIF